MIYTYDHRKHTVEAKFNTTAFEICSELSAQLNCSLSFSLYLSLHGIMYPISSQVLKLIAGRSFPLQIHIKLKLQKKEHTFFALHSGIFAATVKALPEETIDGFMLRKILASQPFHIVDNTLYFNDKEEIGRVELGNRRVILEKEVIKLQVSDIKSLHFQTNEHKHLLSLYKTLTVAVKNATLDHEIKQLKEKTSKTESTIALYNEVEVLEKECGTKGVFVIEEARKQLFHELTHYNPTIKYLEELYNMIKEFENAGKMDKIGVVNKIYNWVKSIKSSKESSSEDFLEKLKREYLMSNAKEVIYEIIPKTTLKTLCNIEDIESILKEAKERLINKVLEVNTTRGDANTLTKSLKGFTNWIKLSYTCALYSLS